MLYLERGAVLHLNLLFQKFIKEDLRIMKNLKKVLALVVALTMVFTTVAFASYPDVDAAANYSGAVELLSALEVLQGDENGNFNPDNTITRAEFAAVVCRALGLEGSAASAKGATMFTDVAADHWASGYINLASQQGIVNGKGNGIFDPEGNVTYAEAVKMLVVAIGYEPMAATKGGYPAGYLSVANSTKMTAGVGGSSDAAALRSTVAMLTANALEIPVMDQTAYGSETKYEPLDDYDNYTSLLTNMDVYKATGIVQNVDLLEGEFSIDLTQESDDYEFGWANSYTIDLSKVPAAFDIGSSNVADYENESVDVYVKKNSRNDYVALIAVPSGIGETLTINATDLEASAATISTSATSTLEYYETIDADKTSKIYVAKDPTVIINGVSTTALDNTNLATKLNGLDAEIKFIENTDDKYFDYISITVYEHAIVEEVSTSKGRIEFLDGNRVDLKIDDDDVVVKYLNAEGAEIELADIKEGDVLAMVVGELKGTNDAPVAAKVFANKLTIYDLGASTVTGTLKQANENEGYIYIDGVEYEYSTDFVSEKGYNDLFKNGEAKLGTEGVFYLGITGKIIGFEGVAGSTSNYAFILQGDAAGASAWDNCYQLKLLLADGTIKTYDLDDSVEVTVGHTSTDYVYGTPAAGEVAQSTKFVVPAWENSTAQAAAAYDRVIDFKANSKGIITEISYVYQKANNAGTASENDYATLGANAEYKESTTKVGGKILASDVVIFDVTAKKANSTSVIGLDRLVDEGKYEGHVLAKYNSEYDVFVMTTGAGKFDPEAPLYVVDSVVKSTYGEDKESSYEVTYYMDGTNETATAIFTSDSEVYKGITSPSYTTLAKGSLFVANTAADGLVDNYVVIANVNNAGTGYDDAANIGTRFNAAYDNDTDASYVYAKIDTINKKYITISSVDYTIGNGAAQYYYNAEGSKDKIVAGDWAGEKVDDAVAGVGNYAFIKLYDGEVTDIITFSARQ